MAARGTESAATFGALWDAIADTLGTATTATLLRRAAKRGAARHPPQLELGGVAISRNGLEYEYSTPTSWTDSELQRQAMCALFRELRPLLVELTGDVVLRRLIELPELRSCGLTDLEDSP
jgi:hypothetical protein